MYDKYSVLLLIIIVLSLPIHLVGWLTFFILAWRKERPRPSGRWLFLHLVIAILAIWFIPFFFKWTAKAKQSEAKANLGAIYLAQLAYFSRTNTYAGGPDTFKLINWEPLGQTRSAYYCQGAMIPNKMPLDINYTPMPDGRWPVDLKPQTSQTGFTCMAVGNIDNDSDLDVWSINDAKMLVNVQNDV